MACRVAIPDGQCGDRRISHICFSKYKGDPVRDLHSPRRQTLPREGRPLSLKYDQSLLPESKNMDYMDMVAGVLLTLHRWGSGHVEIDRPKLAERTICTLREFGEFQVLWAIGAYGNELSARIRRMTSCEKEAILASSARWFFANRMSFGFSTLKMGNFTKRKG